MKNTKSMILLDKEVAQAYLRNSLRQYITGEYAAAELDNLPPAKNYIPYFNDDSIRDVLQRVFPDFEETAIIDLIESGITAGDFSGEKFLNSPYIRKETEDKDTINDNEANEIVIRVPTGSSIKETLQLVFPDYEESGIVDDIEDALGEKTLNIKYERKSPMSTEDIVDNLGKIMNKFDDDLSRAEYYALTKAMEYVHKCEDNKSEVADGLQ